MRNELLMCLFAASTAVATPKHSFAAEVSQTPIPVFNAAGKQCTTDTYYDQFVDLHNHYKTSTQLAFGIMTRLNLIISAPEWSKMAGFETNTESVPTIMPVDLNNEFNAQVTYEFCWSKSLTWDDIDKARHK